MTDQQIARFLEELRALNANLAILNGHLAGLTALADERLAELGEKIETRTLEPKV